MWVAGGPRPGGLALGWEGLRGELSGWGRVKAKGHQASNAGNQLLQLGPGSVQGTAVCPQGPRPCARNKLSSEVWADGTVGEGGPVLWV